MSLSSSPSPVPGQWGSPKVFIDGEELTGILNLDITMSSANTYTVELNTSASSAAAYSSGGCVVNPFEGKKCNHATDESMIEYQDGVVVAYCQLCSERIIIQRVPGGVNKLKVTNILAVIRENPDIDPSILEAVIDEQIAIEQEIDELRHTLLLLKSAKEEVCRRLLP